MYNINIGTKYYMYIYQVLMSFSITNYLNILRRSYVHILYICIYVEKLYKFFKLIYLK